MNVLSYYDPLRALIQNGVRDGFIPARNERLILFVDGPADHDAHDDFDWGVAALEALDGWQAEHRDVYYDWTKRKSGEDLAEGSELAAA